MLDLGWLVFRMGVTTIRFLILIWNAEIGISSCILV
jgi:hypothetical protein